MNKKQKNPYLRLEKVLSVAGVAIVILGLFATVDSIPQNARSINDFFDAIYYYRFALLLGGGFAVAFLVTRKRSIEQRLFAGSVYALFALLMYGVADVGRVLIEDIVGTAPYPISKMVFTGMPIVALVAAVVLGLFVERNSTQLSAAVKYALISVFVLGQLYLLSVVMYVQLVQGGLQDTQEISVWVQVLQYIMQPIVIGLLAFVLLVKVTSRKTRLFYAAFIGGFYSVLFMLLWEFNMDPFVGNVLVYSTICSLITLLATGLLLWRARAAVK